VVALHVVRQVKVAVLQVRCAGQSASSEQQVVAGLAAQHVSFSHSRPGEHCGVVAHTAPTPTGTPHVPAAVQT
jgi:hypothetical protein